MAEKENRVVELLGVGDDAVIQPYFDITLEGGLTGYDHIHADGHVHIKGRPSGKVILNDFVEGEASFDESGNVDIQVSPGAWRQSMFGDWIGAISQEGKVLNIFRRV